MERIETTEQTTALPTLPELINWLYLNDSPELLGLVADTVNHWMKSTALLRPRKDGLMTKADVVALLQMLHLTVYDPLSSPATPRTAQRPTARLPSSNSRAGADEYGLGRERREAQPGDRAGATGLDAVGSALDRHPVEVEQPPQPPRRAPGFLTRPLAPGREPTEADRLVPREA